MLELFLKGGPVMYALLFCSVVATAIIIEKLFILRQNRLGSVSDLSEDIKNQLIKSGKTETIITLKTRRNSGMNVIATAVKYADWEKEDIQEEIKLATVSELPKFERGLHIVSSVITVSPILGLLGTVLGLMDIFNVISGGGLGDTNKLSVGIAEALITTVAGLAICIPLIFLYKWILRRIDLYVLDIEQLTNEIVMFCKTNPGVKP